MKRDFVKTVSITSIVLSIIAIGSVVFVMGREELNSEAYYKDMIKKHYQVFSPIIPNSVSSLSKASRTKILSKGSFSPQKLTLLCIIILLLFL